MENGERNRMREKETRERGREREGKERERGIEERQKATGPRMMISLHTFSRKEVEREKKVGGVDIVSPSFFLSFSPFFLSLLQIGKIRKEKNRERRSGEKWT